jgi:hypothetical protein
MPRGWAWPVTEQLPPEAIRVAGQFNAQMGYLFMLYPSPVSEVVRRTLYAKRKTLNAKR